MSDGIIDIKHPSKNMTYSVQFRKKVLNLQLAGESFIKLSKRFQISTTTISRWKKELNPKLRRNKRPIKIDDEVLKRDIECYPDSYSYERARRLGVSASGIKHAKRRIGITYKKTLNHPKADPEKRSMFCQKIDELKKEEKPIVYIDESGFAHDMPRVYGYSIQGQRCYGTHDWGAKGRTNAIGALIGSAIIAIGLITGSVNTVVFTSWVEQMYQTFRKKV